MNYTLELNTQTNDKKIIFNTITFDTFKINIIDRYKGNMKRSPILVETIFKVRTLNDQLISTKEDNNRVRLSESELDNYRILIEKLNSYQYRAKLIKQHEADEEFVHFMIRLLLAKYDLK